MYYNTYNYVKYLYIKKKIITIIMVTTNCRMNTEQIKSLYEPL